MKISTIEIPIVNDKRQWDVMKKEEQKHENGMVYFEEFKVCLILIKKKKRNSNQVDEVKRE